MSVFAQNSLFARIYSRGTSALEILVILATCGALLRLGIPNWYEFQSRASDIQSVKFYRQLKENLLRIDQSDTPPPVAVFNQTNSNQLANLKDLIVPEHINLHYALLIPKSFTNNSEKSLIAFEVSHEFGKTIFRYIRVGDDLLEQQISKEF